MRAKQIISNSLLKYASCTSYQDKGELAIEISQLKKEVYVVKFQTFYSSPNRFLLENIASKKNKDGNTIFWSNGVSSFLNYSGVEEKSYSRKVDISEISNNPELSIDSCPSFTLPLLMPDFKHLTREIFENNFQSSKGEDKNRFHLVSKCMPLASIDLWINKIDFSISEIHLMRSLYRHSDYRILKVNYEYSRFDKQIPEKFFDYKSK